MATEGTSGRSILEEVDYDAFYRGESPLEGVPAFGKVPWDIGAPQPAVVETEAAGLISGDVLDVGCGLGEHSLFLAAKGYRVTGVDAVPAVIEQNRAKALARGLDVEFAVADATRLDGLEGRFSTVVDSALYHCLTVDQRHEYVSALHRATVPGARLHIFCFSDHNPGFPAEMTVSEENLRTTVGGKWAITALGKDFYTTTFAKEEIAGAMAKMFAAAGAASITPASGPRPEPETDDQGRVRIPVWHLTAERA